LLSDFMDKFNKISKNPYDTIVYRTYDKGGSPIYHTNVVQAILKDHVVLCTEAIKDESSRKRVVDELTNPKINNSPRELIDINYEEMGNMAGNMIMLMNTQGKHLCIMSERARQNLRRHNLQTIEKNYKIVSADLTTIELIGGGSARCMVAELF